jgi:hypothetical protein
MKIFVLTKCISGSGKCDPSCDVFASEQAAKEAMDEDIRASIRDAADKYGINTSNIEAKNSQGAKVVLMNDNTYAWKVKALETDVRERDRVFVLLHAHNGGYVTYAESKVFTDINAAGTAMEDSFCSELEMWSLLKGKSIFINTKSRIERNTATIEYDGDVEIWVIEEREVSGENKEARVKRNGNPWKASMPCGRNYTFT